VSIPKTYSFQRYLEAKKSVDDRALNREVWAALSAALAEQAAAGEGPLHVLEAGAGIGTMLERIFDWNLLDPAQEAFSQVRCRAVDADPRNLAVAARRLRRWAAGQGFAVQELPGARTPWTAGEARSLPGGAPLSPGLEGPSPGLFPPGAGFEDGFRMERPGQQVELCLQAGDILQYTAREENRESCDLLIAHAFLDLLDLPSALPALLGLLRPGGLFYFTLNFDGATLLEPAVDPALDEQIQALYHRTMDERRVDGRPSGDSRTGRHLFQALKRCGAKVLAAGASDWVVFPGPQGYPGDEAYFLHHILHTIAEALQGNPALDAGRFSHWAEERHAQVERGELVYIAHQLDFAGRKERSAEDADGRR